MAATLQCGHGELRTTELSAGARHRRACATPALAPRCAPSVFEHLAISDKRPTAVVVAVQFPGVSDAELLSSISELERLAVTLGLQPVGRLTQRRCALATGIVLGEGKLK